MGKIKVIVDSGAGFSHLFTEKGIGVVPLTIKVGDEEHSDDELLLEELLKFQAEGKTIKTSAPPPQLYLDFFQRAETQEGYRDIICITLSSKVSGSYDSAQVAASLRQEQDRGSIAIIDSKGVSMIQGILAFKAIKAIQEGRSFEEIVSLLESARDNIHIWACLDTLEYALAGGRITQEQVAKMAATFGRMVGKVLKVIITLKDGKPSLAGATIFQGAIKRISEKVREAQGLELEYVSVIHVAAPNRARILANNISDFYPFDDIIIDEVCSLLAAHSGPGAFGVAFSTIKKG